MTTLHSALLPPPARRDARLASAAALPMANTKLPPTGWESAEITR
jgi:hypothetical protein